MRPQTLAHIETLVAQQNAAADRWLHAILSLDKRADAPQEQLDAWRLEAKEALIALKPLETALARFGATFNEAHLISWSQK